VIVDWYLLFTMRWMIPWWINTLCSFNSTWIFYYEKISFYFFLIIILYLFTIWTGCRAKMHLLDHGVVFQLEMEYLWILVCILLQIFHYMISFLVEMTMPWRFCPEFLCACGIINLIFHICDSVTFTFVLINFISTLTGKETIYYHKAKREVDRWRT